MILYISSLLCLFIANTSAGQEGADFTGATVGYTEMLFVLAGQPIEYSLSFENTGQDTIETVTFNGQFDPDILDTSSIVLNEYSHEPTLSFNETGALTISITNAGLVPTSEGGTAGFILFSISSFGNLPHNTIVEFAGELSFDNGVPVSTDTVSYRIFSCNSFSGISGQTEYCEGSQIELHTDDQYVQTYTWYLDGEPWGNSDLLMIPSFPAMDYTISLELSNQLCTFNDEVEVTVNPSPVVIAGEDLSICEGESVVISASSDYTLTWANGVGDGESVTVNPDVTTLYTAIAVNEFGCSGFDQQWVLVTALPDNSIDESNGVLTASEGDQFQWFFNGEPIEGATGQSIMVEESGYYSVAITIGPGCTFTTDEVFVVSVSGHGDRELQVYPNPANEKIIINLPNGSWSFKVFDMLGRNVLEGRLSQEKAIGTGHLVAGNYSIVIQNETDSFTNKFVIAR